MCGSYTVFSTCPGLAGRHVNLKPNTSLPCKEVWCEDLICSFCLTLHSIPPLYTFALNKQRKKKTKTPHCIKIVCVCVCWKHHDLTSYPFPSDMLLGVPAALTLKRLPLGESRLTNATVPAQSHPINHNCCGITVKQAKSLFSALTHNGEEDDQPEE